MFLVLTNILLTKKYIILKLFRGIYVKKGMDLETKEIIMQMSNVLCVLILAVMVNINRRRITDLEDKLEKQVLNNK
jgi:hypothetical protein